MMKAVIYGLCFSITLFFYTLLLVMGVTPCFVTFQVNTSSYFVIKCQKYWDGKEKMIHDT